MLRRSCAALDGFAHQVELVVQVFVELGHHLAWLEPLAIGRQPLDPAGHHAHQAQVLVDDRQHARAQHLDGHLAFAALRGPQHRKVHLRDRRTGHRLALERDEDLVQRLAQRALDGGRWPPRRRTAARGPAAWPVRRQCRRGNRSRRVDSTWPNLTKIGPRRSSASRRRWPRGASSLRPIETMRGQPAAARVSGSWSAPVHPAHSARPPRR